MSNDICALPSLETRWLHRQAPWLPQPQVVFADLPSASGLYHEPSPGRAYGANRSQGIIIVSTSWGDAEAGNTIAHEWRHHYQAYHGMFRATREVSGMDDWTSAHRRLGYWKAVRRHFLLWPNELDALLFSRRVSPSEVSEKFLVAIIDRDAFDKGS